MLGNQPFSGTGSVIANINRHYWPNEQSLCRILCTTLDLATSPFLSYKSTSIARYSRPGGQLLHERLLTWLYTAFHTSSIIQPHDQSLAILTHYGLTTSNRLTFYTLFMTFHKSPCVSHAPFSTYRPASVLASRRLSSA